MKALANCLGVVLASCAAMACGQTYYAGHGGPGHHGSWAPMIYYYSPGYGWPAHHHHFSTATGAYLRGVAAVIVARGVCNFYTSEAMINAAQARGLALENDRQRLQNYFDGRNRNEEFRGKEQAPRHPRPAQAQPVKPGAANSLSMKFDPATGCPVWPRALQHQTYAAQRQVVAAACRAPADSIRAEDLEKVAQAAQDLLGLLKSHAREVPGDEYVATKHFLKRLKTEIPGEAG